MNSQKVAPWKSILSNAMASSNSSKKEPIIGSLATVSSDGAPKVRSVVCRGFVGEDGLVATKSKEILSSNILAFSSHLQSPKISQIKNNPKAEILFWFPKTAQQFRISGVIDIFKFGESSPVLNLINVTDALYSPQNLDSGIDKPSAETENPILFDSQQLCTSSLEAHSEGLKKWFGGPPPGEALGTTSKSTAEKSNLDNIKANFCLLLLNPTRVDYCDLRSSPNKRIIYELNDVNQWRESNVVP
ncbi:hypothetical protein BB559_002043 [Furculomyces boomerangus]|uniref:Pyridoxamine 5'-phosphate oxidase Alr4036 family FMN-binding domain-containing protein n=2 Tax=Harpellales TaxID=61421 RepID=A0A2T9YYJ5_9FUNG|nr:hypothetical protein BB559_002043 [Furculomyces boomerangus]PVZ96965.1 hypothetical protein BB558_007099 [Smittium angustum]PVZ98237.1 hypothetical protein BB558_005760 [Smittium angustum]PWA01603.1 hypothetical protein BB558_002301 [Smittium angustum]